MSKEEVEKLGTFIGKRNVRREGLEVLKLRFLRSS